MRARIALGCGMAMLTLARLELLMIQPQGSPTLDPVITIQLALVAVGAATVSLRGHRRQPYRVRARLASRDVDAVRTIRDWAWARDARVRRLRARRQRVDAVVLGRDRTDRDTMGERWRSLAVAFLVLRGHAIALLGLPLLGGIVAAIIWGVAPDPVHTMWDREGWAALAGFLALTLTTTRRDTIRYTVTLRGERLLAGASRDAAEARDTLAFLVRLCDARAGRPTRAPRGPGLPRPDHAPPLRRLAPRPTPPA